MRTIAVLLFLGVTLGITGVMTKITLDKIGKLQKAIDRQYRQ
jgi:hypothetical protein